MFKWIHHLLNPHCPDCLSEHICKSCEILQYEVERLRADNDKLLSRILQVPEKETERVIAPHMVTRPRPNTWALRKHMLESEDRERAKLIRQAPVAQSTDDLEKELGVAELARESENATRKEN